MGDKAAAVAATEKVISEGEELPKAIVRRVVKDKLSQISSNEDVSIYREALIAFSESARIFIHYLSATANDICKESKRQTINADNVFKALEEIEFTEFIGPLRASLEEFKRKNAGKKSVTKAKDANKQVKETTVEYGGEEEAQEVEAEGDDEKMNDDDGNEKVNEDDGSDKMNEDYNESVNEDDGSDKMNEDIMDN